MGDQKRKAENALISVMIPERGRPEMLERLIRSLCDTAAGDTRYEILVSVDADDEAWQGRPASWLSDYPVTDLFIGPRPTTLGVKINDLAAKAKGDILWFIANDYTMETHGWPRKFRESVAKLPNSIGYPFPHDDLHPDHAAFPIITRKMIGAIGFMFAPWFPYWWIDTWADQTGIMLGVRPEIEVVVRAQEGRGKSHGLKDVTFWATLFNELLPFRARDALGLAKLAYGEDSVGYAAVRENLENKKTLCQMRTAHLLTPEFARVWEAQAASDPGPHYARVKTYAEGMLANLRAAAPKPLRVAIACPSGRTWEASTANCIAAMSAHSAMAGIDCAFINVQSSQITHGRNTTVKIALQENCDAIFFVDSDMKFPPDALLRLLAHDKDIVGATYNKRVFPYQTLGKFKGEKLTMTKDGLHEAELLPGGFILVKTDVYRRLKWPWYAEAYRWDGDDGLDAFKNMIAEYFMAIPPDDVVASLDASSFGKWIKENYSVGNGEFPMYSEDLMFCTKATRAGYSIWCDVRLTNETIHIGALDVTCTVSEETLRLVDAAE